MPVPLLIAIDAEHERRVVELLAARPGEVLVGRRPADEVELLSAAAAGHGSIALITPYFPGMTRDVVMQLHAHGVRVLCLGAAAGARALGADAVVPVDAAADDLLAALHDLPPDPVLPPMPASRPRPQGPGRILAVSGTAGAPGRTSVAIGVAEELALSGHRTILIDADLAAPSVAPVLGLLDEASALAALCRLAGRERLTPGDVAGHLAFLDSGVGVVSGLARPERWPDIGPAAIGEVLAAAACEAAFVVVDTAHRRPGPAETVGPSREAVTDAVLEAADETLYVAGGEVLGMQRLILALAADESPRADRLVVTRVRAAAAGSDPERSIVHALERYAGGTGALRLVPDDRQAYDAALLAGQTLAECRPRSPARLALASLAAEIGGQDGIPGQRPGRRARQGRGRRMQLSP
ncbi:hypothetical protein [Sediminivirga luteola]|uniref:hypothetical protein n=1 Tax=Sediminivirga luteola TaxID=1774748 RepID=UPI001F58321A|nr:hypothetical protein [Sediminivirga luteola]MCI2265625.1 hypothetical protein [Sediminivirga luteola]